MITVVHVYMYVRLEGGEYVLRVGENAVTTLSVELFNAGEDAHDTTLTVTLPDTDVDYLGADSHVRINHSFIFSFVSFSSYRYAFSSVPRGIDRELARPVRHVKYYLLID